MAILKIFSLFIFIILSRGVKAATCPFTMPKNIVVIDSHKNYFLSETKNNCNGESIKKILKKVISYKGIIKSSYLHHLLKEKKSSIQVIFNTKSINIVTIGDLIRDRLKLKLKNNLFIKNIKSFNQYGLILIDNLYKISFDINLSTLGEKNIKINFNSPALSQSFWIQAVLEKKINVFMAKSALPLGNKALSKGLFAVKSIKTGNPGQYIIPIDHINYYKIIKPLPKNALLKRTHISPRRLIRPFQQVEATLAIGAISLNYPLTAQNRGLYGESIKLKNTKTKKIVWGKVIGENKVQIGL